MQAGEMSGLAAVHGKRGITNLEKFKINDPGVNLFTTELRSDGAPGDDADLRFVNIYVDSFPEDDRWMPPLHGDDVDSFSDNLMKELDEEKDNYTEFTRILETNGCPSSSFAEDSLPSFKDETELQHPDIRREIHGTGSCDKISSLSTSFFYNMEKGHIIRPSDEELRRCLDVIPENLGDIAWKDEFQAMNDDAVEAANRLEWETACECYEACLLLVQLEAVKESVSAKIQAWLMLWVCVPLAYLYQFRLRSYSRCVPLYDQVLERLNKTDDVNVVELYYSVIWHRRMVLFQWSYAFEDIQSLIVRYMRFKAFGEVQIVEEFSHYPGFVMLQRIINFWGRRTRRGLEGDLRVAFCANLEHLHRESKQWSEAELWMREKWRWICTFSDVFHELNVEWRFQDVESLFHAGRAEEAQRMICTLEESAASALPETIVFKIRYWKASFLKGSNHVKANAELQELRNALETKVLSGSKALYEELLMRVKLDIGKLNFQHLRIAEILERAPFGVEEGQEWDDEIDSTAIGLLEGISPDFELKSTKEKYMLHHIQGKQLLMSLGKRFTVNRLTEYRDRVHKARDHFQKCLYLMVNEEKDAVQYRDEVFDHEGEVETRRISDNIKIECHISLGYCALYATKLKPLEAEYLENPKREMDPSVEIQFTNLVKANDCLQEALSLAVENGIDYYVSRAREGLGLVHYQRAQKYYEWLRHFKETMPFFRDRFALENGNEKSELKLLVRKFCGNIYHEHLHALELSNNRLSCIFYQFPAIPDSSPSSSSSPLPPNPFPPFEQVEVIKILGDWRNINGVVGQYLSDELLERALRLCFCGLMKQAIGEIKQSTDYYEGSLINIDDVGTSAPFYTAEEQSQRVPHLRISERMKKTFTHLQRLIEWAVAIKDMIGEDAELPQVLSFKVDPATAEFLRFERGYLTRKALLWAERGRSRSLVQQLPANESTHGMVNMGDNQLDEWNKIRNSRLSCGKNTVFVEYNFDTAYEYVSDIVESNRIVTWIVYVVTKDDEVHMRSNEVPSLSDLTAALKGSIQRLSKAEDADTVKEALMDLHRVLIEPISDLLRGMDAEDKLVFAADDVLNNVPFSILLDAKTEKYLFQNHTVSFTPSLQILEHCHKRLKLLQESEFKVEPSVALGDPAYKDRRLKSTYFEVQRISSLFNEGSVKVLTGTEATVENLMRHSHMATDTVQGFIHVAAHNHVDKNHKAGSLQLAHPGVKHQDPPSEGATSVDASTKISDLDEAHRGGQDAAAVADRKARQKARQMAKREEKLAKDAAEAKAAKLEFLPSERIMRRESDWRSCMVVLSACNSAKGYVLASEGVLGLPRAFLLTGVPCIVASQWELEDESSSELMVEFYRELSGGVSDAATALRAAMIHMMKGPDVQLGSSEQAVDVYKWGGYLVWGLPTVTLSPRVMK